MSQKATKRDPPDTQRETKKKATVEPEKKRKWNPLPFHIIVKMIIPFVPMDVCQDWFKVETQENFWYLIRPYFFRNIFKTTHTILDEYKINVSVNVSVNRPFTYIKRALEHHGIKDVKVEYIGRAKIGTKAEVICDSFNAG